MINVNELSKLTNDEFLALEKAVKNEKRLRDNDYTPHLPVVAEDTLWYATVDIKHSWGLEVGMKQLSHNSPRNKKDVSPAYIAFGEQSTKSDSKWKKKYSFDKYVTDITRTIQYIKARVSLCADNKFTSYYEKDNDSETYTLYFIITYCDKSYSNSMYSYHQFIKIERYKTRPTTYSLSVEQHKAVGGFGTIEYPPNDAECSLELFNTEMDKFFKLVDDTLDQTKQKIK